MAVRSRDIFLGNTGAANANVVAYTTPSGETAIVKYCMARWRNATPGTFRISVRNAALAISAVYEQAMANHDSVQLTMFLVLPPGWSLIVRSDVASAVECSFSGAELEGVAD